MKDTWISVGPKCSLRTTIGHLEKCSFREQRACIINGLEAPNRWKHVFFEVPDWEKDVGDLTPGERWQDKHQDALWESGALIIILSPNNIDSPWIFFELSAAVSDNKKII